MSRRHFVQKSFSLVFLLIAIQVKKICCFSPMWLWENLCKFLHISRQACAGFWQCYLHENMRDVEKFASNIMLEKMLLFTIQDAYWNHHIWGKCNSMQYNCSGIFKIAHICMWDWCIAYRRDDVIKWKHFPRNWPFVRGIHRSPVNSPYKGQWRRALIFPLICVWINYCVNSREAGGLRPYRAHYDVIVMRDWALGKCRPDYVHIVYCNR